MKPTAAIGGTLRLIALMLILASFAGCGIYSIHFDPPRQAAAVVARKPPLDVSLSLGEIVLRVNGKPTSLDAPTLSQVDDSFVERVTASRLVRIVLPRGSESDIYYDMNTDIDLGGNASLARSFYQIVAFLPAAIIPGFPYPWQFHRREQVRIRAGSGASAVTIREDTMAYTLSLWGRIWGNAPTQGCLHAVCH